MGAWVTRGTGAVNCPEGRHGAESSGAADLDAAAVLEIRRQALEGAARPKVARRDG